ncbi:hypothetical protein Angca_000015, partial [Angiostrongylus cantonensis]
KINLEPPAEQDRYEMVVTCLTSNKSFEDYSVTSLMDGFPKIKILHVADILDWAKCTRQYHEEMAKLLD